VIIWRGFGFLVAVIGFAALILAETVSEKITGDDQFYQQHGWVVFIGMLVAAALTYGLHRLLLLEKQRVLIDRETGGEVAQPSKHSLFFVPVQLWPAIFIVLGLVFAVAGPRTSAEPGARVNGSQPIGPN
jgi:hypothetical protein